MNILKSKLLSNNHFIIYEIPCDNSRKLMKIKIFLNSNSNLKYILDKNLEIIFLIGDKNIITKEIQKCVAFIEKTLLIKIDYDSDTKNIISNSNEKKENFNNALSLLKNIKFGELDYENEYLQYCDFCNSTLSCKLRPYQYKASFYLTLGHGGFDFSVPGSGKTIISYAAYNYFKNKDICNYVLIIGPINSYNAWIDEYSTCFDKKPNFISLANYKRNEVVSYLLASSKNHNEITFINVDKVSSFKKEIINFMSNKKILLIVDEAHKEKNPEAQVTKAVLDLAKYSECRIVLTGTPMPNGYEDLYTLMHIYSPYEEILPYKYFELKKMTKNGASDQERYSIMQSIKPVYSRVSKQFLLNTKELLSPIVKYVNCSLSNEQREIYDFLNELSFEIDDDFESKFNLIMMKAILIRKMQVSANPGLLSKSIINTIDEYKKEYIQEYDEENTDNEMLIRVDKDLQKKIENSRIATLINKFDFGYLNSNKNIVAVKLALSLVEKGEKVIIWDVFVQNMYAIKKLIEQEKNIKVEIINGMITGESRQNAINNFRNGHSEILIANPATLAESISLHKCCQNAIYVNRNYNAAQFIQSKDRIHRINMPKGKTATYYFLINEDTIDSVVDERLLLKENRMLEILDSDELKIGGGEFENTSFMSVDDIIDSFRK